MTKATGERGGNVIRGRHDKSVQSIDDDAAKVALLSEPFDFFKYTDEQMREILATFARRDDATPDDVIARELTNHASNYHAFAQLTPLLSAPASARVASLKAILAAADRLACLLEAALPKRTKPENPAISDLVLRGERDAKGARKLPTQAVKWVDHVDLKDPTLPPIHRPFWPVREQLGDTHRATRWLANTAEGAIATIEAEEQTSPDGKRKLGSKRANENMRDFLRFLVDLYWSTAANPREPYYKRGTNHGNDVEAPELLDFVYACLLHLGEDDIEYPALLQRLKRSQAIEMAKANELARQSTVTNNRFPPRGRRT